MKMILKIIFLLFIVAAPFCIAAQSQRAVTENIDNTWQIFTNGEFKPFTSAQKAKAIYFKLNPTDYGKSVIEIRRPQKYHLLINGNLLQLSNKKLVTFNLDSLQRVYGEELFFTIYSGKGIDPSFLSTSIITQSKTDNEIQFNARIKDGFTDFFILATLMLALGIGLLFRANPHLMADYLNVVKLFSLKEREGNLLANRVTSSSNILYYLTSSFLASLLLIQWVRQVNPPMVFLQHFKVGSTAEGFAKWVLLSVAIIAFLLSKLTFIYLGSVLFKLKGMLQLHFFNFIRMLILLSIIVSAISLVLFISHQTFSIMLNGFLAIAVIISSTWLVVTYLKLLTNTSFRSFHLFSYLCATEIIPTIVLIKILS